MTKPTQKQKIAKHPAGHVPPGEVAVADDEIKQDGPTTQKTCPQTENEIKTFEGKIRGSSSQITVADENEKFLTASQVKARYGDMTEMTLRRRMENDGFPKPIHMGERRLWKLSELVAYERLCVSRTIPPRGIALENKQKATA